ncbi:MAG TPA: C4-dicarboxylate ABC transporter [Rubrivivax sp.]|nr:C4-dicarboxylate ABC transporter [Rubrivivax sp.]
MVMGLAGLSLAWHRAVPLLGEMAGAVALLVGVLAAAVFAVLAVATVVRGQRYPEAWAEDRRHPVRHTFIAALPVAVLLLATVGVVVAGPQPLLRALWWAGSLAQLFVTWWVLARWWRPAAQGGLQWASVTPALFVAIVGNVLVPLAGVPLGQAEWSAAQFGLGLLFWPLVTAMVLVRMAVQGLWPERMLPTAFIFVAPPAVVGLSVLQFGAPLLLAWVLWGMASFTLLWVGALAPRIVKLPFGLPHWAVSFPLAAITALTLRLANPGTAMAVLGLALLALTSIVVLGLLAGTLRGLRDGTLLAPEPVAAIQPVAAAVPSSAA